jgi:hypothetical protein
MPRRYICVVTSAFTLIIIALFLAATILQAQQPRQWRIYEQEATKALQRGDTAQFLKAIQRAQNLRPDHPRLLYKLALAQTFAGNPSEALRLLNRVAAMGVIFQAAQNSAFNVLQTSKDSVDFQRATARFAASAHSISTSSVAFTINEKGLITESVAFDPIERVFYVSSVHKRKILSVNAKGVVEEFSSPADGLWSAFGMKVDAQRRSLWVASGAIPEMQGFSSSDEGATGIFQYDLRTHKLLRRYVLPRDSARHWFGDLTLNARGDVFVSDSKCPTIYCIRHGSTTLKPLFTDSSGVWESLQGLCFSKDERTLFVADYATGLFALDMRAKTLRQLTQADTLCTLGIDGLYYHHNYHDRRGGALVAIQNGITPNRVVHLSLSNDERSITGCRVLEANTPLLDEPTLGVVVGTDFYFVANSQWGAVNDKGELATEDKLQPHHVLKLSLKPHAAKSSVKLSRK